MMQNDDIYIIVSPSNFLCNSKSGILFALIYLWHICADFEPFN
jgi:hypothetical protein